MHPPALGPFLMPDTDRLTPDDIPAGSTEWAESLVRRLVLGAVARDKINAAGMAAHNAEMDAEVARLVAEHQIARAAHRAGFVGPPLPRGFRARPKRGQHRARRAVQPYVADRD